MLESFSNVLCNSSLSTFFSEIWELSCGDNFYCSKSCYLNKMNKFSKKNLSYLQRIFIKADLKICQG
jgi:hypothetical protein